MAAPLTNFQAGGEDLSDIYVDQTTVTTSGDFLFPESSFSDEGISAVFGRAIWSFGGNNDGQLGQQDRINRSSPVLIGLLSNWKQITSNGALAQFGEPGYGAAAWNHFAAVKSDGTMWVWGSNNAGRLGLNDALISRSSPVQIGSLTNWKQVAANAYSCMAINNSGSMWAWGRNARGQLGDNSTVNRSSPVQIGTLTDWKNIAGGFRHCLAIKTDGSLWGWGSGADGRLGLNATIHRSSPIQIGTLTNWRSIAPGYSSSLARKV